MKRWLSLFVVCAVSIRAAHAYGPTGHEIVGAIADELLAGKPAGEKVHTLLDGFTLEKAAVVPDEIKGWDKNGPDDPGIFHYSSRPRIDAQLRDYWKANPPTHDINSPVPSHHWFHYTDVPVAGSEKYGDGKIGRTQWDIVHAMRYCIAVLHGDEPEDNARKVTKPIAIILLAHFVGDIHQPLHVAAEYFAANGQGVNPDSGDVSLEDQGGNTITLKYPPATAQKLGHPQSKLHGFWDNEAVKENLPDLPETMPKEERRTKTDEARKALIEQFVRQEPSNWRLAATVPLADYPEAWANDILPVAREAHARLRFINIHAQQEENGTFAVGEAEEKPAADKVSYEDWAGRVVHDELHKAGWRLADLLEKALP
jgi:S1/P1 Nuclease